MRRTACRLAVVLLVFAVVPTIRAESGTDPKITVDLKLYKGVRAEAAGALSKEGGERIAPYDSASSFRIYSPALIVHDLPTLKPGDDAAELKKAFHLQAADRIHETTMTCQRHSASSATSSTCSVDLDGRVLYLQLMPSGPGAEAGAVRVRIFEEKQTASTTAEVKGEKGSPRAFGGSIPSNALADVEVPVSAARTAVVGFLDSRKTPYFLVLRPS